MISPAVSSVGNGTRPWGTGRKTLIASKGLVQLGPQLPCHPLLLYGLLCQTWARWAVPLHVPGMIDQVGDR